MNVIFSTDSKLPERVTPVRETERASVTPYLFGMLLLLALAVLPALLRVLAFVPQV